MQIIKYPHPTLRYPSKPLRRVDAELRTMILQMFDLMYEHQGIGLAANQVDLPYRLVIVNLLSDPAAKDDEHVFINPVITYRKGSAEDREGCLSLPQIYGPVVRSDKIVLNAYNPAGQELTYELDGMAARAVQHEVDHLDGILFIDRLSPTGKAENKDALEDLELEFYGDRRRGIIPDDGLITARLSDLEATRT